MKRETMKRGLVSVILMLAVCFSCMAFRPVTAKAAETVNVTLNDFLFDGASNGGFYVYYTMPYTDVYPEIRVFNNKMEQVAVKDGAYYKGTSFVSVTLAKNRLYFYQIVPFIKEKGVKKYVGGASPMRALCTVKLQDKSSKRQKNIKLKCPKMAGVKSVKVLMSTNKSENYRGIGRVRPGNTMKSISKFRGKAFQYWTYYYFRTEVTLKSGIPCDSIWIQNLYFTRTYR